MTSPAIRAKFLSVSASALMLGSAFALPAFAQTAGAPPQDQQSGQAAQAPSGGHDKATCEADAMAQGLKGAKAKAFVAQCMKS